jgi:hypothetical protein
MSREDAQRTLVRTAFAQSTQDILAGMFRYPGTNVERKFVDPTTGQQIGLLNSLTETWVRLQGTGKDLIDAFDQWADQTLIMTEQERRAFDAYKQRVQGKSRTEPTADQLRANLPKDDSPDSRLVQSAFTKETNLDVSGRAAAFVLGKQLGFGDLLEQAGVTTKSLVDGQESERTRGLRTIYRRALEFLEKTFKSRLDANDPALATLKRLMTNIENGDGTFAQFADTIDHLSGALLLRNRYVQILTEYAKQRDIIGRREVFDRDLGLEYNASAVRAQTTYAVLSSLQELEPTLKKERADLLAAFGGTMTEDQQQALAELMEQGPQSRAKSLQDISEGASTVFKKNAARNVGSIIQLTEALRRIHEGGLLEGFNDPDALAFIRSPFAGEPAELVERMLNIWPRVIAFLHERYRLEEDAAYQTKNRLDNLQAEQALLQEMATSRARIAELEESGLQRVYESVSPGLGSLVERASAFETARRSRDLADRQYLNELALAIANQAAFGTNPRNAADAAQRRRDAENQRITTTLNESLARLNVAILADTAQRRAEYQRRAVGGFRDALSSYENLRQPDLPGRIVRPYVDTFTGLVADQASEALFGPAGLLGAVTGAPFNRALLQDPIQQGTFLGVYKALEAFSRDQSPEEYALDELMSPERRAKQVDKMFEGARKSLRNLNLKALGQTAGILGGAYGGAFLGEQVFGRQRYTSEGAGLGSAAGFAIGGPWGALVGGLAGGLLGGLFGKPKPPKPIKELSPLERIERNTAATVTAIQNQTDLLTLDNRLLNVPSSFTVPSYRPLTTGSGLAEPQYVTQQVSITIQDARDPDATAAAVAQALRGQLRASGTFVTRRSV